MSEITVSEQHRQALELHQKILVSANLAQQNIWDMCNALKTMRDNKLYKELGYTNFEEYCENEVGMKRSNAYRYISIVEKISKENVPTLGHFSKSKLMLLATVSEPEQAEIAEKIDLESTTVRELKAEIDKLKQEKRESQSKLSTAEFDKFNAENQLKGVREHNGFLENELRSKRSEIQTLTSKVKELENRPIEVAVAEPSDNERRLSETIKALERENIKRNDELEAEYRENEKIVRKQLENEKQEAITQLRNEYESRIAELASADFGSVADDKDIESYRVYCVIAGEMLEKIKVYFENHLGEDEYVSKYAELQKILHTDYPI